MKWLLRLFLAPPARRALQDRYSRMEIRRIMDDTLSGSRQPLREVPAEKTVGGRVMVYFAALTARFHRALVARGLAEVEARRRTAAMTWLVNERLMALPWLLVRLARRSPERRLRTATGLYRQFPFSAPSYQMVDATPNAGTASFDVHRCPVAEYFRAQGLSELCVEAWCNSDFPLAKKWGARLERTGTLAQGAARCDFRWYLEKVPPAG